MVMLLSSVLDLPLRERNTLLLAAGFAPMYAETQLEASELASVRGALDAILRQQEPFPAVVMNRYWDILRTNEASARFSRFLLGDRVSAAPLNLLRRMFDPHALRPYVANWEQVAQALIQRVHRECIGGVTDERTRALLAELLAYPGVPRNWNKAIPGTPITPVIPIRYVMDGQCFNYFSTVTSLGTPQDITVQEIRIECFFPADAGTEGAARRLSAASNSANVVS
jgi:MmyB-like transcription regulator ligand binding domain